MSSILQNSIWPNANGNLGEIKVQIPTNAEDWPTGDALVGNFVFNKGNLVGFVDTEALTANSSKSTTFPYDYVNIQVDKSLEGTMTFNKGERTKYLTISYTESGNSGSESFDFVIIDFNTTDEETINTVRSAYKVVDKKMYDVDGNVIGTWDTSKIEVGGIYDMENMVADGVYCNFDLINEKDRGLTLTEFDSDLSSLRDGYVMFGGCSGLTSFSSDLSSLANGGSMFPSCTNLTSFSSDLTKLKNGDNMFYMCSNLTSFSSNLSSLTNGLYMFEGCKLDAPSVKNIIDTINIYPAGLHLGVGCDNTAEDKNLFIQEMGYDSINSFLDAVLATGWEMDLQFNGRPTTTYGLRRPTEDTLPVFAKLEEDEKHGNYTSDDESKKYRLHWFHMTTGSTDGYTQFNSLEEAVAHFNVKPIERNR